MPEGRKSSRSRKNVEYAGFVGEGSDDDDFSVTSPASKKSKKQKSDKKKKSSSKETNEDFKTSKKKNRRLNEDDVFERSLKIVLERSALEASSNSSPHVSHASADSDTKENLPPAAEKEKKPSTLDNVKDPAEDLDRIEALPDPPSSRRATAKKKVYIDDAGSSGDDGDDTGDDEFRPVGDDEDSGDDTDEYNPGEDADDDFGYSKKKKTKTQPDPKRTKKDAAATAAKNVQPPKKTTAAKDKVPTKKTIKAEVHAPAVTGNKAAFLSPVSSDARPSALLSPRPSVTSPGLKSSPGAHLGLSRAFRPPGVSGGGLNSPGNTSLNISRSPAVARVGLSKLVKLKPLHPK